MVHVAIIGTGDFAYGLSHLFKIHNSPYSGNELEVTKPNLNKEGTFHDTRIPLTNFDDALIRADVLILAIPGSAIKSFVSRHLGKLKSKILVDVSNSDHEDVELEKYNFDLQKIHWVKAFNDVGAIEMLLHKPSKSNVS